MGARMHDRLPCLAPCRFVLWSPVAGEVGPCDLALIRVAGVCRPGRLRICQIVITIQAKVNRNMWDTRSVELSINLPAVLADTVEEVRERDPEYLQRVILYGMARRAVYQSLSRQIDLPPDASETPEDPTV